MPIKEATFHTIQLPTITLRAVVGLGGPYIVARRRDGSHAGAAPLGGCIDMVRRDDQDQPWWIAINDVEDEISMPFGIDIVREVARTFGILGEDMGVGRAFYGSPVKRRRTLTPDRRPMLALTQI